MQDDNNIVIDSIETEIPYQIFINDIVWSKDTIGKFRAKHDNYDQLPKQMTLILPDSIAKKEALDDFYDIVETFIYNFLAKKFNRIANHCQIWLVWMNESNDAQE